MYKKIVLLQLSDLVPMHYTQTKTSSTLHSRTRWVGTADTVLQGSGRVREGSPKGTV